MPACAETISDERFTAIYHLTASDAEASDRAWDICLEQTVEFPDDLIPTRAIRERIVGRIASIVKLGRDRHEARIAFPVDVAGGELTQLLNVLFGNVSIKPGVRLMGFELPASLANRYRGPRFGQRGLRERLDVWDRPLLSTAIKPMGLSPKELAEFAYRFALGGIDLIKDDHGLANQSFVPFRERVTRLSEAVERANRETGLRSAYLPNITAPADQVLERARLARELGAGGYLIAPGLAGWDAMRRVADDDACGLPIMSHPAFLGAFTSSPLAGIAHGALYGQITRLAGADATIFPNYGGRFAFSIDECRDIVRACNAPMASIAPIFPAPAGGMKVERTRELCAFYGRDSVLLIGGDLHRPAGDLVANCRRFENSVRGAIGVPPRAERPDSE
ncbi:MAG: ribulose 1,5-bisphosphate carboxylase large subunit [Planctomycetes bacterium]|nr:ribulose 1,5-bisphosphate carboxylase large subunit [Planctomycetota bacterium]